MARNLQASLCGAVTALALFILLQTLTLQNVAWLGWRVRSMAPLALSSASEADSTSSAQSIQTSWAGNILPDMRGSQQKTLGTTPIPHGSEPRVERKAVVMRRTQTENASWVREEFPDWEPYIYSADNLEDALQLAGPRGYEANAYLTFIIDHWDNLPDITVFMHAHRTAEDGGWHIDNEEASNSHSLARLNMPYVQREGYANLRCALQPGCPAFFQTLTERLPDDNHRQYDNAYKRAWPFLFPGVAIPDVVAAPCCAQFAVSKQQILARPKADYVRMWLWLAETDEDDHMAGTVMEYVWHIIFGKPPQYCPSEEQCLCDTFDEYCYELESFEV